MGGKVFIPVLCLWVSISVQAQSSLPLKRSQLSFKSEKVKDANGDISHVKLGIYADGQRVQEFTYELEPPVDAEMAETIGTVSEEDINFDGYPDADIYLGYMGGFANNTRHEGLLWDEAQHRMVEAKGYGEIGEPQCESEKKYIYTVLSSGPDHRVTTYYRWHGNRLVEYLTNTWAIEDDEYVDFTGLLNQPCYRFDTRLDGRIPAIIVFQKTDDDLVAGYIYYPRAKHPAPILIKGTAKRLGDTVSYSLEEHQPDGTVTGTMRLETPVEPDYFSPMNGTWTNPTTGKQLTMANLKFSREMPKWFTRSALTP